MEKKESYYFSHDSNAIVDTKILNMRCDYGLEGYGLYWAIVEMLRNEESFMLELSKNTYRAIKTLSGATIDVEKYIKDCIEDYELFCQEGNMFFSKSLIKRMEIYESKRRVNRENGKLGGRPKKTEKKPNGFEDKTETKPNGFENETENNQRKGKEKKGKENKGNEIQQQLDSCVDEVVVEENIFKFYEENFKCSLSPYVNKTLKNYEKEFSNELIIYAMKIAIEQDRKTIKYLEGILNNWRKKSIKTIEEAQKENERYKKENEKNNAKKNKTNFTQREYPDNFWNQFYATPVINSKEEKQC